MSIGEKRFYNVGWPAGAFANTITGYSGTVAVNSFNRVNTPYATCFLGTAPLSIPSGAQAPFNVDDPQSFTVGATGTLHTGGACDQWSINEVKALRNVQLGY